MSDSSRTKQVLLTSLVVALAGLAIYLAVAREIKHVPAAPPTRCDPHPPRQACPAPVTCPKRPYFQPLKFTVDFFGLRYHGNTTNLIDRHIIRFGAYEKDVLFFLRDVMRALRRTGGVFVDVGANTGLHSAFMSRHAGVVHAFEPYPPVLARFRAMIRENRLRNIIVHPVGLGDAAGEVPFHAPPENNLGSGSFVGNLNAKNKSWGSLRIVVGDQALKSAGVGRVDLVKIDVEGFEKPVLVGLRETLARSRPVVVVEVSIDPTKTALFSSGEELTSAFPPRYEFLRFVPSFSSRFSGAYQLRKATLNFSRRDQAMLVAWPRELRAKMPIPRPDRG